MLRCFRVRELGFYLAVDVSTLRGSLAEALICAARYSVIAIDVSTYVLDFENVEGVIVPHTSDRTGTYKLSQHTHFRCARRRSRSRRIAPSPARRWNLHDQALRLTGSAAHREVLGSTCLWAERICMGKYLAI